MGRGDATNGFIDTRGTGGAEEKQAGGAAAWRRGLYALASFFVLFAAAPAKADNFARVQELLSAANRAVISGCGDPLVLTITDQDWIHRMKAAMGRIPLGDSDHDLSIGWRTADFYHDNEFLISIAAIHGNLLRLLSSRGGGDFPVEPAQWQTIDTLLKEKGEQAKNRQTVKQELKEFEQANGPPPPPKVEVPPLSPPRLL